MSTEGDTMSKAEKLIREELPLKPIYDEALIGYVYSAINPRCFASSEDEQERIPVYDLAKVEEIHFREFQQENPNEDPDDLGVWATEELDQQLMQLRAIYVQRD
jgi:hypothetical protein